MSRTTVILDRSHGDARRDSTQYMKHTRLLMFVTACLSILTPAVYGQTANLLAHSVIVANPPDSIHFEKAIGNFTSTSHPSYFLGTSNNGYTYDLTAGRTAV